MRSRLADMHPLVKPLIHRFRTLFDQPPPWAWPFRPSIPLVGSRYKLGRSLLVYASAENFTWLVNGSPPSYLTTDQAWNRYRIQYDLQGRRSESFFPDVGIQPVTDGGLLAAALFVAERHGMPTARQPRPFLETLAVSNWCKFSFRAPTNRDYLTERKRLVDSLPYVVCELSVLQPRMVLLPHSVWAEPFLRAAMRGASPATRFLPTCQFNATVVNTHLRRYGRSAHRLRRGMRDTVLADWLGQLLAVNREHAWRYIAFLEEA